MFTTTCGPVELVVFVGAFVGGFVFFSFSFFRNRMRYPMYSCFFSLLFFSVHVTLYKSGYENLLATFPFPRRTERNNYTYRYLYHIKYKSLARRRPARTKTKKDYHPSIHLSIYKAFPRSI